MGAGEPALRAASRSDRGAVGQAFQAGFSRNRCQVPWAFALIGVAVFTAFGTQILQILYGTRLLDYTYLIGPMVVCAFFTAGSVGKVGVTGLFGQSPNPQSTPLYYAASISSASLRSASTARFAIALSSDSASFPKGPGAGSSA